MSDLAHAFGALASLTGPLSWCQSCRVAFPDATGQATKCPVCTQEDAAAGLRDAETQRLVQAEREACARVVESLARDSRMGADGQNALQIAAMHLRARGGPGGV